MFLFRMVDAPRNGCLMEAMTPGVRRGHRVAFWLLMMSRVQYLSGWPSRRKGDGGSHPPNFFCPLAYYPVKTITAAHIFTSYALLTFALCFLNYRTTVKTASNSCNQSIRNHNMNWISWHVGTKTGLRHRSIACNLSRHIYNFVFHPWIMFSLLNSFRCRILLHHMLCAYTVIVWLVLQNTNLDLVQLFAPQAMCILVYVIFHMPFNSYI